MTRPFSPRDLCFGLAALVLLAAVAWIAIGPGATPVEGAVLGTLERSSQSAPAPEVLTGSGPATTELTATPPEARETTAHATSGVIRGNVALATNVVQNLQFVYVMIREAVNEIGPSGYVPYVRTVKLEIVPEAGTPDFAYADIPFSAYGYRVRVFAEGVNGTEQYVPLDEAHPVADVILSVTAGVPFTILVRNQFRAPAEDLLVFMVPLGDPTGRPMLQKTSDGFGAAVFENVLQGDYEIRTGALAQSRSEPQRVQVLSHAGASSATVEVPHGVDLKIIVQATGGWGLEGIPLTLWQTDTTQFRKYDGVSDRNGEFVFKFMTPGSYQLNVAAANFHVFSKSVEIPKDDAPQPLTIRLVPR